MAGDETPSAMDDEAVQVAALADAMTDAMSVATRASLDDPEANEGASTSAVSALLGDRASAKASRWARRAKERLEESRDRLRRVIEGEWNLKTTLAQRERKAVAGALACVAPGLNRDDDDEAPDHLGRESDEDEGGDEGDDALLRRELGDDYEAQREHWGGDYRHPEPTSERELIASRVEELERLVDSEKRTALARKRGGDHEGVRNALRAMKAAQAELADASAMLAALEAL
mgnify:CR=1 FL=1